MQNDKHLFTNRVPTPPSSDEGSTSGDSEPNTLWQTPRARIKGPDPDQLQILTPPNSTESKRVARTRPLVFDFSGVNLSPAPVTTLDEVVQAVQQLRQFCGRGGPLAISQSTSGARPLTFTLEVPRDVAAEFIDKYAEDSSLCVRKFQYFGGLLHLDLMGGAKPHHDIAPLIMQEQLEDFMLSGWIPPAVKRRVQINTETFNCHGHEGVWEMVPDVAIIADNHFESEWPLIVWEIGNTQKFANLMEKKSNWFHGTEGAVRVVITVKFISSKPVDDPTCVLQVWRCITRDLETGKCCAYPPPKVLDARAVLASQQEAIERSDPGQMIITYQEGPDYTISATPNNHSHQSVPLTFEDWFGAVSNDNPLPVGMSADDVLPIDMDIIYNNVVRGIRKTLTRDQGTGFQNIGGARTPPHKHRIPILDFGV
ncbi:hypothetical protein K440DRAFT_633936 [Wilcoxina mikolae CBS 423.85]|nr:hypothetical protein K440DRAFT_633936 [Wilcoxina mikolae CBS 423.85]